jgi:micrococcal nuclease
VSSLRNLTIIGGLLIAASYGCAKGSSGATPSSADLVTATCSVVDGDTLKCDNGQRLRLNGIDAPELPGHCAAYRHCAPGDPYASTFALESLLFRGNHVVQYRILKTDHYGRAVVEAYSANVDLSCAQLAASQAIYKPQWDEQRLVAACADGFQP